MRHNYQFFIDLDGVILDPMSRLYHLYSHLIKQFGGRPIEKLRYCEKKRNKVGNSMILQESKLPSSMVKEYEKQFMALVETPQFLCYDSLINGSNVVLSSLRDFGKCCLVTVRRNRETLMSELERFRLGSHFEVVLSQGGTRPVEIKKALIRRYGYNEKTALIVGDTETEILTGRELGIATVAVTSGLRSREFLARYSPDMLINSVAELPAVLLIDSPR